LPRYPKHSVSVFEFGRVRRIAAIPRNGCLAPDRVENSPVLGNFCPCPLKTPQVRPVLAAFHRMMKLSISVRTVDMSDQSTKIRHARLFEMLRQQNQASRTVARVKGFEVRKISAEEADEIKAMAKRSFEMRA
jgi:hypothetical protein